MIRFLYFKIIKLFLITKIARNIQVIKPINKIQEANQDLNEYQKITKSKRKKIEYKKNKPTVGKGLENREKEYNGTNVLN